MLNIALGVVFVALIIAMAIIAVKAEKLRWIIVAIVVGLGATIFMVLYFLNWWFVLWAALLALAIYLLSVVTKDWLKAILVTLLIVIAVGGFVIVLPLLRGERLPINPIEFQPITAACTPAKNLNLQTGGKVENNLDDGDAVMGTILKITRDNPSKEPLLAVIMPGASLDIEYVGEMYFTSERFEGSLEEAVCLADTLFPAIKNKVVVGAENLPTGWQKLGKVDGWWTTTTWLYQEEPIRPEGLTASEGIFVSVDQSKRDLRAKEGEVIYGQFWTTSNPGYVVHVQVRSGQSLTIPKGWQGTYWIWTGDFKVGENDLQKRMIQATFKEVAFKDEILGVTLLACGSLPSVDGSLLTFNFKGNDITWNSGLDGWDCKPIK